MNLFQVTKKQPSGGLELKTFTGNPVTFTPSYSEALPAPFNSINLKANILATGGNGTPSTPIPIVGHSELNLVRCGKNLVYRTIKAYPGGAAPYRVIIDNDSESAIFYAIQGTTYTISSSVTMNRSAIVRISSPNPENLEYCLGEGTVTTNTWVAEWTGWTMWYKVSTANLDFEASAQVELGSTATTYAPYNGTPYLVSFGQTVYGGEYDANAGKVRITSIDIDLGSLDYIYQNNLQRFYSDTALPNIGGEIKETNFYKNVICEIYENDTSTANNTFFVLVNNGCIYIYDDRYTSASDFKAALSGIKAVYELATPIEIDVSELSVDTIVGVNNIISDGGGDIEVQCLI